MDSLGAVEISNSISAAFRIELSATFMFDYPTINAMVSYLSAHLDPSNMATSIDVPAQGNWPSASRRTAAATPTVQLGSQLAGMACRYPAGADDPDGFWQMLAGPGDVQSIVPRNRWDIDDVYAPEAGPGKMSLYTRYGVSVLLELLE